MLLVLTRLSPCHFAKSEGVNPFSSNKFDSSKLKESADNNFVFDENGRKFSKGVGKKWQKVLQRGRKHYGKRKNYEQFLLFLTVFLTLLLETRKNQGLFGKGLMTIVFIWFLKILIQKQTVVGKITIMIRGSPNGFQEEFVTIGSQTFFLVVPYNDVILSCQSCLVGTGL